MISKLVANGGVLAKRVYSCQLSEADDDAEQRREDNGGHSMDENQTAANSSSDTRVLTFFDRHGSPFVRMRVANGPASDVIKVRGGKKSYKNRIARLDAKIAELTEARRNAANCHQLDAEIAKLRAKRIDLDTKWRSVECHPELDKIVKLHLQTIPTIAFKGRQCACQWSTLL